MTHPKVSIIMLNWNGLEDTIECLESLKEITYPNYEVVIVDNGSKGNDADVLEKKYKDYIRLIRNERNFGFCKGNNVGIKYALKTLNPDFILLLNNDTIVDKNFLDKLIEGAKNGPKSVGIVGPTIYHYYEPERIWFNFGSTNWLRMNTRQIGPLKKTSSEKNKEFHLISGCCMLIKSKLFQEVGYFNEKLFAHYEDFDLCFRARKQGYSLLYIPESKIWHKISAAIGQDSEFYNYFQIRNRIWMGKKYLSRYQYPLFVLITFAYKIPARLTRLLFQRKISCIKKHLEGAWDGISDTS